MSSIFACLAIANIAVAMVNLHFYAVVPNIPNFVASVTCMAVASGMIIMMALLEE